MLLDNIRSKRNELLRIAQKYGARNLRVFGSVIHGEETPDSDVDFLVCMEPDRSLLDMVGLQQELSRTLARKVDVISENGINRYLKDKILSEAQPL